MEELGEVADDLRQLYTDVGLRPYRVFLVNVGWSGGQVGRGVPTVTRETELLPTPLLREWTQSVQGESTAAGTREVGRARLEQVSPRYTEDAIRELVRPNLDDGEETFVEVRHDSRDGETHRRRFVVRGVPYRKAGKFEWRVGLSKQDEDRDRQGGLDESTDFPKRLLNPLMGE